MTKIPSPPLSLLLSAISAPQTFCCSRPGTSAWHREASGRRSINPIYRPIGSTKTRETRDERQTQGIDHHRGRHCHCQTARHRNQDSSCPSTVCICQVRYAAGLLQLALVARRLREAHSDLHAWSRLGTSTLAHKTFPTRGGHAILVLFKARY